MIDKILSSTRYWVQKILYRVICTINPNAHYTFHIDHGIRFKYPLNTSIGYNLFVSQFEQDELDFAYSYLKPGDTFIDIGANGGIFSLYASQKVGDTGRVYAFEPDERMLALMNENIKLNNLQNITVVRAAVGDKNGKVSFAISDDAALNSLRETDHPLQSIIRWEEVDIMTLDSIIESYELESINLIKIDVEGAEKMVFEGATKFLSNPAGKTVAILFESADRNALKFDYSTKDWLQHLISQGHHIYYIDQAGTPEKITQLHDVFGHEIYSFLKMQS